jgi:phytoene desaturase
VKTITGASDHVVIVGAGLGGLSAALRLAGAGRRVTILEREPVPGGRAGVILDPGYAFDTGPTVLTMPDLIADAFDCVGETVSDWLDLIPLNPIYRGHFPDGSTLDLHADIEGTAQNIAEVCGPQEAVGYRKFVEYVGHLYKLEMRRFIDANHDSPLDLLSTDLARLIALGGFRRLASKVAQYLHDPRTQRLLSFQAMYAGLSPQQALAIYSVISYMDTVAGVFVPRGGMHAVPRALAAAATKHGVDIRYNVTVTSVERSGSRATAVITADGERIACDALVLNPDLPVAQRELLGVKPRRLRYSPSCLVLVVGSNAAYSKIAHHNIHFGRAWRETFRDVIDRGRLMQDPSFLVTAPTITDPDLAPPGRHSYYVLLPTPNLDAGIDWDAIGPHYRDEVVDRLERSGYIGFGDAIEVEHAITPADWQRRGMERGTPFAASHTFGQTGPFRPSNIWGDNIVFTGSGTRPGVGVPMVLISGRLAAERILGPDPDYRSRAWL